MSFRPPKTLPILSIFHNPKFKLSQQALALMQQKSQQALKDGSNKDIYKIDIIEPDTLPTKDQLEQMAQYLHSWEHMIEKSHSSTVSNLQDAEHLLLSDATALQRPFVVDWSNGKAAVGITDLNAIDDVLKNRLNTK